MTKKKVKDLIGMTEIENPKKDFRIVHNEIDIKIVKGESVTIPDKFLSNLVTEGVIDKIPTKG